jgi:hypothetical protein
MTTPPSELAWRLADYQAAGTEPPARIVSNPGSTEGEMMTDEEVAEFIKDSIATLRILSDKHSKRYSDIQQVFAQDLTYLAAIGRISEEEHDELANPQNLHF